MDRNSYSHVELHEIFGPFATMLVRYEKIDNSYCSAEEIHTVLFPNINGSGNCDYFSVEALESAFISDKYVRKCITNLIGTGGEFEKCYNGSSPFYFKFKNNIDGISRREILALSLKGPSMPLGFDLKTSNSSRLSELIRLIKEKLIETWKDSFNKAFSNKLTADKKLLDDLPGPSQSTRSGGSGYKRSLEQSVSTMTEDNSNKKNNKKFDILSYMSDLSDERFSEIVVSQLIGRQIKTMNELYNFAGVSMTRDLNSQMTESNSKALQEINNNEKDNRINSLLDKVRVCKQRYRRAEQKLLENNIECEPSPPPEIIINDYNNPPPPIIVAPIPPIVSISDKVLLLVEEANVLSVTSHHNEILSVRAGLIIQDLRSTCNCAMEKIPHIILLVLVLFFGILDYDVMDKLIKSSKTYNIATERTNHQLRLQNRKLYSDISYSPHSIIATCLSADASNKKDNNWIIKPAVSLSVDLAIRARSFDTDFSISKKSSIGSETQFDSIVNEIGYKGAMRIRSGCADGFGVAEMVSVMKKIDEHAISQWNANTNQETMMTVSPIIETDIFSQKVVYWYGPYPIRYQRVKSCQMHALQICFEAITSQLMGDSGLTNDATVSQNLFKISYFQSQFKHHWNTLNIIAVGGSVDDLSELSKKIINKFKKFCSTRWLSVERQSDALVEMLKEEAPLELILLACETIEGGVESNEWKLLAKKFSCINDKDKVSHMILMFHILSNHTPGGKSGVGYQNCSQIVAFLCSSQHRIAIKICAALYEKHIECARFIDSTSNITKNTLCINTKLIEAPVFEREFMEWSYLMLQDWKSQLPDIPIFMEYECNRATTLNLLNFHKETVLEKIETLMLKGCETLFLRSEKYFQEPLMGMGFNILHSVDPYLSRHWATAVLQALTDSQYINLSNEKIGELYDITQSLPIDPVITIPTPTREWKVNDTYYAFPNMSYTEYRKTIYNQFYVNGDYEDYSIFSEELEKITGIVSAYAMDHPAFIDELFMLASGNLLSILKKTDYWQIGTPVEGYYNDIFEKHFPIIADSLFYNFSYCLYAQTIAEQQFTVFTNVGHSNSSESTMRKDLSHFFNVRSVIIRNNKKSDDLIPGESTTSHIPSNISKSLKSDEPKRDIRSKGSRLLYVQSLCDIGDSLYNPLTDTDQLITKKLLIGKGKRNNDKQRMFGQTQAELIANRKSKLIAIGNAKLTSLMDAFYISGLNDQVQLPAEVLNIYETALAIKSAWPVKYIKAYIMREDPNAILAEVKHLKRNVGANDPPNYRSLVMYITDLWVEKNITENELKTLSTQMIEYLGEQLVTQFNIPVY